MTRPGTITPSMGLHLVWPGARPRGRELSSVVACSARCPLADGVAIAPTSVPAPRTATHNTDSPIGKDSSW